MLLADGYSDLPPGKLANVATFLEMRARPSPRSDALRVPCTFHRVAAPDPDWYRAVFRRVGEPYLWSSRLLMNDEELLRIVRDEDVAVYALEASGEDAGLVELDFRVARECELRFFGLTSTLVGRGVGRWLMNRAIEIAWSRPIERFWVHTCTLDHPDALAFYIRSGFVPFKRQIEIYDDPRATGLLPKTAAPGVPII